MKDKLKKKAEILKMLSEDMMDQCEEREYDDMMGAKATIMAEDEQGLMEGAKKLPEILKKAKKLKKDY